MKNYGKRHFRGQIFENRRMWLAIILITISSFMLSIKDLKQIVVIKGICSGVSDLFQSQ